MCGEEFEVAVRRRAVPFVASGVRGAGELAEQIRVVQQEAAQQWAVVDGQEVRPRVPVQQAVLRGAAQRAAQFVDSGEDLTGEDRAEQLLAGLPVQVDGAFADGGPGGHVVDGHVAVAAAGQEIGGSVEDPGGAGGALLRVAKASGSSGGRGHAPSI